jgi:uncharacterized protein DUF4159
MARRLTALAVALAVVASTGILMAANVRSLGQCGPAPPAKPHRKKAAEGFGPLPLPAVPLRRTETKRQPRAPLLVGKLKWSANQDWLNDPGDLTGLMNTVRKTLGMWYGYRVEDLGQMVRRSESGLRNKIPIIFMNGHKAFQLTEQQRLALKRYVTRGGTLLLEACCGMPGFSASAKREIAKMFPNRELAVLPVDHPIYNSYYKMTQVTYEAGGKSPLDKGRQYTDSPKLRAVHIGPRAAVIWSEYDLSCGWDKHTHPYGRRVQCTDAMKLGVNLVAYSCANSRLGKYLAKTRELQGPNVRRRQQFVFAQVRHNGDWNPMPGALGNLLKEVAGSTSASVRFERKEVDLKDPDLYQYPFLYMTGMRDPGFAAAEVKSLRRYLSGGGFLLADATYGLSEFDVALRGLVKQMFPDAKLERLTKEHPVFHSFSDIDSLVYTTDGGERPSELEALTVDGHPVLVYSRYDLGCGWARYRCPYRKGIASDDAIRLGVNIIVFAMQN